MNYEDEVVYCEQSEFQQIVLTRWHKQVRLFLDGEIQFSSSDERMYHEALTKPVLTHLANRTTVCEILVLGGGDGLVARDILKGMENVVIKIIDIDPIVTSLCAEHPLIVEMNGGSLRDERVHIINADAKDIQKIVQPRQFSAIIVDLPDPAYPELVGLYSSEFYEQILSSLMDSGILTMQANSPFFAPITFKRIMESVTDAVVGAKGTLSAYQRWIPSWGFWGFVAAYKKQAHTFEHLCPSVYDPYIDLCPVYYPDGILPRSEYNTPLHERHRMEWSKWRDSEPMFPRYIKVGDRIPFNPHERIVD